MSQPVTAGVFRGLTNFLFRRGAVASLKALGKYIPKGNGSSRPPKIKVEIVSSEELQKVCDENFKRKLEEAEKLWKKRT